MSDKKLNELLRKHRQAHTALEVLDMVKESLERIQNYADSRFSVRCGKLIKSATIERNAMLGAMDRAADAIAHARINHD